MIEVLPHSPEWISLFTSIKSQVWPNVQQVAISIEHVGSTAIPGLHAKPIIDMAIVVDSKEKTSEAILALKELGYEHRGDLGIIGREAFKRPINSPKHNLYVVLKDSLSLKNHLLFKNYLLNNADARKRYSDLKMKLARDHADNIDLYVEGKTSFIVNILKQLGMSDSEIKEIEDANKAPPSKISSLGMSDIPTPNAEQKMAQWFLRFSEQTEGSPMYRYLSQQISSDRELLALASYSNPTQPAPNLFLAAIHFLLMEHPSEELAKYYPSLEGQFQATSEMFDCFKRFSKKFEPEIKSLLQSRLVQTNEVQRCALLFPALNFVSKKLDHQKIALIDVGASGGLNFLMDQAYIRYSDGASTGAETSPLQIICESKGEPMPRFQNAQIAMRIGVDLNPVNLLNPDERQWNLALIWPDQTERTERIKSALQLLETTDISFKKGSANQVLPQVIRDVPSDQAICVMHSFTLNQFSKEDREAFDVLLIAVSKAREIWRISLEWIGTQNPELSVTHYTSGNKGPVLNLAQCHGHGEWIQWIDDQEEI